MSERSSDTLLFNYGGSTQGSYGQAYVSTTIPKSIIEQYDYVTVTGGASGRVFKPGTSQYLNLALGVKVQMTAYESLITDDGLTFDVSSNTTGLGFTILLSKH